jgi:hypothetical protein
MTRLLLSFALALAVSSPALAQSLHLQPGQSAIEGSAGWSVGPSSDGLETHFGAALGGRVDVGVGISRYTLTFDDGFESTFKEYAPYVRWFPVKEQAGAPVSLSVNAQLFVDDYESDEDSGKYVQVGTTVYKEFKLGEQWAIVPYLGFAFVAESYAFGGGDAENAQYLTRDLGVHFTTRADRPWLLRLSLVEQSFRRETYRGARVALIRRVG